MQANILYILSIYHQFKIEYTDDQKRLKQDISMLYCLKIVFKIINE